MNVSFYFECLFFNGIKILFGSRSRVQTQKVIAKDPRRSVDHDHGPLLPIQVKNN